MKNRVLLPLTVILIASPMWARQHAQSSLSLSTTALSFNGSSGNPSSQPVTITDTSEQPVVIQGLSFSSKTFSASSVSLPVTLSRGQSLTIQVAAQPVTAADQGTLTVATSAGNVPVPLTETATQSTTAHQVSLTWNKPTTGYNVVAYDVDRAPSGGTSFSQVGTTEGATRSWTDTSIQGGQTYVYRVRSVGDEGDTSAPSNTVTLAIP